MSLRTVVSLLKNDSTEDLLVCDNRVMSRQLLLCPKSPFIGSLKIMLFFFPFIWCFFGIPYFPEDLAKEFWYFFYFQLYLFRANPIMLWHFAIFCCCFWMASFTLVMVIGPRIMSSSLSGILASIGRLGQLISCSKCSFHISTFLLFSVMMPPSYVFKGRS